MVFYFDLQKRPSDYKKKQYAILESDYWERFRVNIIHHIDVFTVKTECRFSLLVTRLVNG